MLYVEIVERRQHLILNEEAEEYVLENVTNKNKEEKGTNNRHDKCFRDILSDKNEVISLLKDFVNTENTIKADEIEPYNTSFVTSKYQNREADILYKIKNKNAFILIEHQSKIDHNMQYRLLEYYTEILRIAEKKSGKMPIVMPIIIYTGDKKWKTNGYMSEKQEMIEGYEEGRLNIKYNLVQANNFKTEDLLNKGTMLANAMIIENSINAEVTIKNLIKIIKNTTDEEKLIKLKNITNYILRGVIENEDIEKIEKVIEKKEDINIMSTLAERIKRNDKKKMEEIAQKSMEEGISRGISQGISRGMSKGIEKATINMTKKLKKLNIPLEQIMQVTGLTAERIKSIK